MRGRSLKPMKTGFCKGLTKLGEGRNPHALIKNGCRTVAEFFTLHSWRRCDVMSYPLLVASGYTFPWLSVLDPRGNLQWNSAWRGWRRSKKKRDATRVAPKYSLEDVQTSQKKNETRPEWDTSTYSSHYGYNLVRQKG